MPSLIHHEVSTDSDVEAGSSSTAALDADLLRRLGAGDSAAFAAVVDGWSPVMLRVARRYVGDRQAAEDVVQETWLDVIAGLAHVQSRSSVRSWAFSILIDRARTRAGRDARVGTCVALSGSDPTGPTVDPARFQGPDGARPGHWTPTGAPRPRGRRERRVLDREVGALIEEALDGLPDRQRLVVEMRDVEGMSAEETCATLRLTPQNQRVLLHRGRATLRATLEDHHR